MRNITLGVSLVAGVLTAAFVAGPCYAMSFDSVPTRNDGTQFADPDEQIENFAGPSQAGPLHLFTGRPAGNQFRSNWYFSPWYFGDDHRTRGQVVDPSKSHQ